jgi:hypothetical protein
VDGFEGEGREQRGSDDVAQGERSHADENLNKKDSNELLNVEIDLTAVEK